MDVVGRFIAIILAVILVVLFPLQYIAQAQDKAMDDAVSALATEFTDTARHQGHITLDMYEDLIHKLNHSGSLYDVKIESAHPVSGSEIESATLGDKMPDLRMEKTSFNSVEDDTYLNVIEKNEVEVVPMAAHVHTDNCYEGHRHTSACGPCLCDCGGQTIKLVKSNSNMYNSWKCVNCGKTLLTINFESQSWYSESSITAYLPGTTQANRAMWYRNESGQEGRGNISAYYIWQDAYYYLTDGAVMSTSDFFNKYRGVYNTIGVSEQGYQVLPWGLTFLEQSFSRYYGNTNNFTYSIFSTGGTTEKYVAIELNRSWPSSGSGLTIYTAKLTNRFNSTSRTYSYTVGQGGEPWVMDLYERFIAERITLTWVYDPGNPNAAIVTFTPHQISLVQAVNDFSPYIPEISEFLSITWKPLPRSCGIAEDTMADCNKVVTSISATSPIQTVLKGGAVVTTATATYLDGHTGIVNCSSNFNPNFVGTQNVTLTYSGLAGNAKTTGTRTCTVNVTIKVPYKLTSITVLPQTQNVSRYTNPSFTVNASYDNGSNKNVTEYSLTNYNNRLLGTQTVTITYSENGVTKSATAQVQVNHLTKICPVCDTVYELDENDIDQGCPSCKSTIAQIKASPETVTVIKGNDLPIIVEAIYKNGDKSIISDWTSNYDPSLSGIQEVIIMYQNLQAKITVEVKDNFIICPICKEEYPVNEDGTDLGCPSCRTQVISISATPEQVIIEKHDPLPITVTATFRDGHMEEVNDWIADSVPDIPGSYEITIYYKTSQTSIQVAVKENDLIVCPYCGLEYSFSESPIGCPVCYETIIGIEASLRNGGNTVQYNSDLKLEIDLIFKDTHKEVTYNGWTVEGYRPNVLGTQTISVTYENHSTTLTIIVVNDLPKTICPNGHEYYMNEDGTDPGCPYCANESEKDNAIFLLDITYRNEIIEALYSTGIFYLEEGDYLTVTITPKEGSLRSNIKNMFFGTNRDIKGKSFTYGGEVNK